LDRSSLLGLIGELAVLEKLIAAGDSNAVAAWKGPSGGIHDFERGGRALEVKATSSVDGKTVTISNLDQLDSSAVDSLHLAAVHLREGVGGRTVDELISSILAHGAHDRELISAVAKYGYVFESGLLDEKRFEVRCIRVWPVGEEFPGLRRNVLEPNVLKAVSKVKYDLDLDACPGELKSVSVGTLWTGLGG
jgi:hypothetical protein